MSTSELSDALNPHFFDQQLRSDMDAGIWGSPSGVEFSQQEPFPPAHPYGMNDHGAAGSYGHPAMASSRRQLHNEDNNGMAYGTAIHPNYPPMHPPSPAYPPPQHNNNSNFARRMSYDQPSSHNYLLSPADSQRFSPPRPTAMNSGPIYGSNQSLPRSLPPTQPNTPIGSDTSGMSFSNHPPPPRPSRSSSWDPSILPPATANAALLAPPPSQQEMHQRPPRPSVQVGPPNMQFQPRGPSIIGPRSNGNNIPNVSQSLQRRSSPVAQIASSRPPCPPPPPQGHEWVQAFKQENARRHAWEQDHERKQRLLEAQVVELKGMVLQQQAQSLTTQQLTPSPSPSVSAGGGASDPVPRKRRRTDNAPERQEFEGSEVKREEPEMKKRRKRETVRCLTLSQAMRVHMLRLMSVDDERALPSLPTSPSSPGSHVRFDWDKSTKQSSFNSTMKNRVLASLREEHGTLYPDVPKKEFSQKSMDKAFEDVFNGFRQKWKETKGTKTEQSYSKPPRRGRSASGSSTKKTKLERRMQARSKSNKWPGKMFDGCFQLECMSEDEEDSDGETIVRRSIPWRSSRLVRFLDELDGNAAPSSVRRRDDGEEPKFLLPPSDVSRWMVSKRWVAYWNNRKTGMDLNSALETLYADDDDDDDEGEVDLSMLGSDSESDLSELDEPQQQTMDSVAEF